MEDISICWSVILDEVFSTINHVVLVADLKGTLLFASKAAIKVFGYSPETLTGQPLSVLFHEDDMQYLYPNLLFLANNGQSFEGEVKLRQKNNASFFAFIVFKPCYDPNLNKTVLALCIQDINQQKNFEKLIRETRFEDLIKVANGVAHELRNPLVGIGGFAKRLMESCQATDDQKKYYNFIIKNVSKIEKIVERVNSLVSMPTPVYHEITLSRIVEKVIKIYSQECSARKIELINQVMEKKMRLDEELLTNALSILIENAIDATNGPGTIRFESDNKDDHYRLIVRDTGSGIKSADLPYIFIPFFSTKTDGAGIDLALVKRIMEIHGGSIQVQSFAGLGSTFFLSFPHERRRRIRIESFSRRNEK